MTEFNVHFQKGRQVGARSFRVVQVEAESSTAAFNAAKATAEAIYGKGSMDGYGITRIDHFESSYDDSMAGAEGYRETLVLDY